MWSGEGGLTKASVPRDGTGCEARVGGIACYGCDVQQKFGGIFEF